ncbi:hypothetical protein N39L_55540 [Limnospira platensis NIES-39]|nr:hypothetical protein N39L_55540 [Arthrospira platensis NIES-39]
MNYHLPEPTRYPQTTFQLVTITGMGLDTYIILSKSPIYRGIHFVQNPVPLINTLSQNLSRRL